MYSQIGCLIFLADKNIFKHNLKYFSLAVSMLYCDWL